MEQIYTARYLVPIFSSPIEDGALHVRAGRIVGVGPRGEICRGASKIPCTDFGDAILIPPLVNAHTHLELTHFSRWKHSCGEHTVPSSFVDWILQVIRVKRSLPGELYQASIEEGMRLSLTAGTGAVGDVLSYYPGRVAYAHSPLFGRYYLETLGRDPAQGLQVMSRIVRIVEEGDIGQLQPGLSPHSPYSLSRDYLESVLETARRNGVPTMMHLAESQEESEFLNTSSGELASRLFPLVGWGSQVPSPSRQSPIRYLNELGGLAPWNLLVHGVQVDGDDLTLLARSGCTMVLCPRSNTTLGVGLPPIGLYIDSGVSLALGTDSLASCDTLSVWDEIAFAKASFQGKVSDRDILRMATLNGAKALGIESEMGTLEKGRGASFQVLKPHHLPALENLEGFLCAPGRTEDVKELYLVGNEVLQRR